MKQITRKEWTTALRSGTFTQGKQRLLSAPESDPTKLSHCCLGVLSVLAEVLHDPLVSDGGGRLAAPFHFGIHHSSRALIPAGTKPLLSDFDVHQLWNNPKADENSPALVPLSDLLMGANDIGVSFELIADFIDGVGEGTITSKSCPVPAEWFANRGSSQVGA